MTPATKATKSTDTIRVSKRNAKRLTSLAGKLQMNSAKMQTLDDAINYLFDNLEKKKSGG